MLQIFGGWSRILSPFKSGGGCCRAMALGNFQCRGVLPIWIIVGEGPTVLAVGAGKSYLDTVFSHLPFFLPLSRVRLYFD